MTRRPLRLLAVALTALTSSLVSVSTAPAAANAVRCGGGGRVMLANAYLTVVRGPAVDNDGSGYYACSRGARRGVYLFSQDYTPLAAQLAGRFVVDETVTCDTRNPDSPYCVGYVVVYDGRTRRTRRFTLRKTAEGYVSRADTLAVNARGWAVWLRPATGGREVWVWAPGARPRLVAAGAGIEARSLAVTSQTLYWTDSGQPRALKLTAAAVAAAVRGRASLSAG